MKKIAIFAFAALMGGSVMNAQQNKTTQKKVDRKEFCTQKANRLADRMKLDDKTQEWFVPLYAAYQDTLIGIRRSHRMMGKQKMGAGRTGLTDAEATACVENALKRDELTLKVKREYYAKLKKHLTPQQMVGLFCTKQAKTGQNYRGKGGKAYKNAPHRGKGHGHNMCKR